MVAFVNVISEGGYNGNGTATSYGCAGSSTTICYDYYAEGFCLDEPLKTLLMADMPWLFNYDEPWKAPVHYPPAPRKITGKSATVKKYLTVRKQPVSRMGFRRGQRM